MNTKSLDLLIVNGLLMDPFTGAEGRYSIGVQNGKIAGVYPERAILPRYNNLLDLAGAYITPGWIDLHTHVAYKEAAIGIEADCIGIQQGVTTVVDAGSSGSKNFLQFEKNIIQKAKTRVLSWLNISAAGLYEGRSELETLASIDVEATKKLISSKAEIRGIKVRMSHSVVKETNTGGLKIAKKLASQLHVPLFVHVGNCPPVLGDILNLLGQGDIVTHIFHGKAGGCLDAEEYILPELKAAIGRGIYLDLGHGTESCSFFRFKNAREKGICIDSISTDLYSQNYSGPVYSLKHTMEKCMALGMSFREVITAVTLKPAIMLNMPELGRIKAGALADMTFFEKVEGEQTYIDADGNEITGTQQLQVKGVVREGKVIWR